MSICASSCACPWLTNSTCSTLSTRKRRILHVVADSWEPNGGMWPHCSWAGRSSLSYCVGFQAILSGAYPSDTTPTLVKSAQSSMASSSALLSRAGR